MAGTVITMATLTGSRQLRHWTSADHHERSPVRRCAAWGARRPRPGGCNAACCGGFGGLDALIDTAYFSTVGSKAYEYRVLPSKPAQQDREPSRARTAQGPHRQASRTAINSRRTVAFGGDRHLLALAVISTIYGTTSVRQYVTPPARQSFSALPTSRRFPNEGRDGRRR
ncbi:MAG TPA: hypothetical protein VFW65_13360 [Pseudonocardiaceae bacterium]|nr:hypothetical protein [Pseudonocardiaceae bacterium]